MQLDYKFKMIQKQKLALTNSMKQSIEILQMPVYDLYKYIQEELERNPVLEGEITNYSLKSNNAEYVSQFAYIEKKKSLKDYLYEQLLGIKVNNNIENTIKYMIECIDDRGYLVESIQDISNKLNMDEKEVEISLKVLQSFDPLGIAARDLRECLLIQAKGKLFFDDKLEVIIMSYMKYVADNNYKLISENLKITEKEAQDYIDIIKKLEPKPSRGFFTGDETKFIVPDAYVIKMYKQYTVIMNDSIIPTLNINKYYTNMINNIAEGQAKYIKESIVNASNLIKAIEARKNTLCRLLEYVVKNQQNYFEKGMKFLKPMTLNEVATNLEVHPSTLSRAIKDKYIFTSFGTIKIKSLFCSGIYYKDNNEELSVNAIKIKIKKLIQEENKNKPLSDQVICNRLNEENLKISRRTVAKYREDMGIKSSSKRKRI